MANPFRQQSRLRKLVYFGLILALFTASLIHRRFLIEPEAMALQLREQARGQVDLTSSAVSLTLTGSRGVATCGLWWIALEKQKKQEWNELELVVRSITKLQPHFTAPWRFLSWNLSFNVAVECDRTRDKYFYVSRGLELLAEGERRNQGTQEKGAIRFPGNPDMRYDLGFFYHLKIGQSDEKQYMRCLLDLSCIDPLKREPGRFWGVDKAGRRVVRLAEFEDFCRSYPRLVRRLRQRMGRARPEEVIAFLEDNKDVPSRFEPLSASSGRPETPLKHPYEQFPILPSPNPLPPSLPDPAARDFSFSFDVDRASHAWYVYAQEPLPPPDPDQALHEEVNPDPYRYRLPKMSTVIFRSEPARALFSCAENLEREGWFDSQAGWKVPRWFDRAGAGGKPREVIIGTEEKYHAQPAWQRAYQAYLEYGQQNGLYYSPDKLRQLEAQAKLYQTQFNVKPNEGPMMDLRPEYRKGGMGESFDAHRRLLYRLYARSITNFDEFLNQSAVEQRPETIAVRKLFFEARELDALANRVQALHKYEEALRQWEDLLLANASYRRVGEVQVETYEEQARYLKLRQQLQGRDLAPLYLALSRLGQPRPGLSPEILVLRSLPDQAGQDEPAAADSPEELVLERDPQLLRSIVPLRQVSGRFDMLYVFEGLEPTDPGVLDVLAGLTQIGSLSLLTVSPYQRDRMLVLWTPASVPLPTNPDTFSWRPLLSHPAVEQIRRLKRPGRPGGNTQPVPGQTPPG
jgi:tetratricopeptide (TPR) repeat protein